MIFHLLTAVLVVLKALELINWSWWLVLLPTLAVWGVVLVVFLVGICAVLIVDGK